MSISRRSEIAHCLHRILHALPQLVWAARADGYIDFANRQWRWLAASAAIPLGHDAWQPFLHPEDRDTFQRRWRNAVASGTVFEAECRLRFARIGSYRWYLARAMPLRAAGGAIVRWCGTTTEIDVQKALEQRIADQAAELQRMQETLQQKIEERSRAIGAFQMSRERFARVFRQNPDAMSISASPYGSLLDVNERWQDLFGYTRDEAIGRTAQQLRLFGAEEDGELLAEASRNGVAIRDLELTMRDREGRALRTVISAVCIDDEEPCVITIVRDVTAQRYSEAEARRQHDQLAHLARIVMLGELSAAFAHELNQPLTAILTNAQAAYRFMARDPPDLGETRAILDDIITEDKRAAEVIRRLRMLLMKGESSLAPLDFNELVRNSVELVRGKLIESHVAATLQLNAWPAIVKGDGVQLQQVLLNLIMNACEAMADCDPACLHLSTEASHAGAVQLTVCDNGPGIAPDVFGKVFESFFTTKRHGLGFGLSISRAIVERHGGRIEAGNNPGGGAAFRLVLPIYNEENHG